jgi:hypothetical protein
MPAFHLQERICRSTAKIGGSAGLDCNDQLEEVSSPNVILVINFELMLDFESWIVLQALLDVCGTIGIEQA